MAASEGLCRLALSHLEFLRPREKLALVDILGGARRLFELTRADIAALLGRTLRTESWDPARILELAEQSQSRLTPGLMGSIFYWDAAFPPLLRAIYDPPAVLFWRGTPPRVDGPLAAIVGTRVPTGGARKAAFRLAFELARAGMGTASGLARGIDSEAHAGCVAAGGYTVAVLGSGVDIVSPSGSMAGARALLEAGGTILSEYPPGTPPRRHHFPARNRIISGLARATVVVQAPGRSGALITAEYALDQGRDLCVHAAGIEGSAGAGARALAESGAPVVAGAGDCLAAWGMAADGAAAAGSAHGHSAERMPESAAEAGPALARRLRAEIDGSCALAGGEAYWRE